MDNLFGCLLDDFAPKLKFAHSFSLWFYILKTGFQKRKVTMIVSDLSIS